MQYFCYNPDYTAVTENADYTDTSEPQKLTSCSRLSMLERPIFVQHETIERTYGVGCQIVQQQKICIMSGKTPEEEIQYQYIDAGIEDADHAKPYDLPKRGMP